MRCGGLCGLNPPKITPARSEHSSPANLTIPRQYWSRRQAAPWWLSRNSPSATTSRNFPGRELDMSKDSTLFQLGAIEAWFASCSPPLATGLGKIIARHSPVIARTESLSIRASDIAGSFDFPHFPNLIPPSTQLAPTNGFCVTDPMAKTYRCNWKDSTWRRLPNRTGLIGRMRIMLSLTRS